MQSFLSGWQDSNLRPHAPKARILPTVLHPVSISFANISNFFQTTKHFIDFFHKNLIFNISLCFMGIKKENLDFNFLWEFLSRLSGKYILSLKRIVYAIILNAVLFLLYTFVAPLFSLSYQLCFGCNGKAHGEHWGTNCSVPLLIKQYVPLNLNILFFLLKSIIVL